MGMARKGITGQVFGKLKEERMVGPSLARASIPNVITGWTQVLEDAERGLVEAKARVRGLKRAIHRIESKIAANEPFPGGS